MPAENPYDRRGGARRLRDEMPDGTPMRRYNADFTIQELEAMVGAAYRRGRADGEQTVHMERVAGVARAWKEGHAAGKPDGAHDALEAVDRVAREAVTTVDAALEAAANRLNLGSGGQVMGLPEEWTDDPDAVPHPRVTRQELWAVAHAAIHALLDIRAEVRAGLLAADGIPF